MMNTAPLYALPLPRPSQPKKKHLRKRKRSLKSHISDEEGESNDAGTEYSAIVTPEERAQRRLAGIALDRPLPPLPFPHGSSAHQETIPWQEDTTEERCHVVPINHKQSQSLRSDHLAVIIAILHRCLEQREYTRASTVMAVLLRTETSGKTIDLRHTELWGIAAEILLRTQPHSDSNFSRQGFDRAKVLYSRLAMQHPWHRSWPSATNAQDFKVAMFSLWIAVVDKESKISREQDADTTTASFSLSPDRDLQVREWELEQAETISKEMDSLMGSIPFIDDPELIRLRAMVALWIADLINAVDLLAATVDGDSEVQEQDNLLGDFSGGRSRSPKKNERAIASQDLAKTLFRRLDIDSEHSLVEERSDDVDMDMIY